MRRISLLKAIRPRIHVRAEGLEPSSSSEHRLLRPACFPDFTTPAYADSVGGETADIRFVVDNDKMRPPCEVRDLLALAARGMTASEIARHAEIPRSTIRDWLNDPQPSRRSRDCAGAHDLSLLEASPYAYLLGMYLGDGCISRCPRDVWRLRITLDAAYPGIVAECVGGRCCGGRRIAASRCLPSARLPSNRSLQSLEALALPDSAARPREEARAADRARRLAAASRVREPRAVSSRSDPQRRHADHRYGTQRQLRPACPTVCILEPLGGHPRTVPRRVRGNGRPLHAVERQADLDLQQGSSCATRRVHRPEDLS